MTTAVADDEMRNRRERLWLVVLGVLALALGVLGLFMAFTLTVVSTIWYGALLAVLGAAHLVFAFREKPARWLNLLLGIVYLIAGIIMLTNPLTAAISLTLLIGLALAALGIARVVWSFWLPGFAPKLFGVLGGLISVALGWLIVSGWPWTGFWFLGLFLATDLIIYGFTMIGVGRRRG